MVSRIACTENSSQLTEIELDQLVSKFFSQVEEGLEEQSPGYFKAFVKSSAEESVDDAIAYTFSMWLNIRLEHMALTQYDEYRVRHKLATIHVSNYFRATSCTPFDPTGGMRIPVVGDLGEKTRRCGLWRWLVIMGKHILETRENIELLLNFTETVTYCRSMVQTLKLEWSEDHIISACMSYIELNHRR